MRQPTTIARSRLWSVSGKAAASAVLAATFTAFAATPGSADGQALFATSCGSCHKKDGTGIPGLAPPLAAADWAKSSDPRLRDYVPLVVLNGLSGKIVAGGKPYVSVMPPQKQKSDEDIAQLANFVVGTLNAATTAELAAADVAKLREQKTNHKALLELRGELAK